MAGALAGEEAAFCTKGEPLTQLEDGACDIVCVRPCSSPAA